MFQPHPNALTWCKTDITCTRLTFSHPWVGHHTNWELCGLWYRDVGHLFCVVDSMPVNKYADAAMYKHNDTSNSSVLSKGELYVQVRQAADILCLEKHVFMGVLRLMLCAARTVLAAFTCYSADCTQHAGASRFFSLHWQLSGR